MSVSEREQRAARKVITYQRMYGAGEIKVGQRAGVYPAPDYTAIELRILATMSNHAA